MLPPKVRGEVDISPAESPAENAALDNILIATYDTLSRGSIRPFTSLGSALAFCHLIKGASLESKNQGSG